MKIKNITYRNRRDFKADFECEFCGHIHNAWGYDDSYFHSHVIPNMVCPKCGMKSNKVTSTPKYDDSVVL